jgi:phage baseplate assembly protein V
MNNIFFGIISEIKGCKARVAVDDLTTDYLPVIQMASEFKRKFEPIRVKEQCIILAPYGDINAGVILRGLYYSAFPAPEVSETKEITVFEDGTKISYDSKASELMVDVVKSVKIICKTVTVDCEDATVKAKNSIKADCAKLDVKCDTANVKADEVLVESPSIDLGGVGGLGVITQECICSLTGKPHPEASTVVRALKIVQG